MTDDQIDEVLGSWRSTRPSIDTRPLRGTGPRRPAGAPRGDGPPQPDRAAAWASPGGGVQPLWREPGRGGRVERTPCLGTAPSPLAASPGPGTGARRPPPPT